MVMIRSGAVMVDVKPTGQRIGQLVNQQHSQRRDADIDGTADEPVGDSAESGWLRHLVGH